MSAMQQVIAERVFTLKLPRGKSRPVTARIFAPRQDGKDFACRIEVDGLGKPIRQKLGGVDSIQTIELAMVNLGEALRETREWHEGRLLHYDSHDLGLPLRLAASWETYQWGPKLRFVSDDGLSYINLLIAGAARDRFHVAAFGIRDGFSGAGGGYIERYVLAGFHRTLAAHARGILWSFDGAFELRINTRGEGRFASLRVTRLPSGCSTTVTLPVRLRDVRTFDEGIAKLLRKGGANAKRR
jgi:hypothetical protein